MVRGAGLTSYRFDRYAASVARTLMVAQSNTARPEPREVRIGSPSSFAEELGRHERLLLEGRPAARLAVHRGRALSYGVGVRPEAEYLRRARTEGIPTIRRTSGGSGVLHLDGDLLWAVVLPRSDERAGRDFTRAYRRLGRGVVEGLAAVGISASWAAAPGLAEDYCFLSSRGEVLLAGGKVLGGAAQHVSARTLLHHGAIAWTVDRTCVDRLFDLPAAGPSSRLGGLAELAPTTAPRLVAEALGRALHAQLGT